MGSPSNVYHGSVLMKIVIAAVAIVLVFMLGLYGAGSMFTEHGFTISLAKDGETQGSLLSLSESADFADPTVRLSVKGAENMTNIAESDLPEGLTEVDGSHNGANYIAYTFYVKNAGDTACRLIEDFNLNSAVHGADDAIRIRVHRNGVTATYAKLARDGMAEYGTIPFASENKVFANATEVLNPGDTIKYTLVIWIEGNDPECLDNIKGGNVEMSIEFSAGSISP